MRTSLLRLTNSETEYGLVTKALHWSVALLILVQFAGGIGGIGDDVHASFGVLVLVLATLRLAWRLATRLPDWAPTLTPFEHRLIHAYEWVLYAMLFVKPITGLLLLGADGEDVHIFGLFELPPVIPESDGGEDLFGALHFWSGVVLLAALALHAGLVLRHQLLLRDGLLRRMLPFTEP